MSDKIIRFPHQRTQPIQRQLPHPVDGAQGVGRTVSERAGVADRGITASSLLADGPLSIVLGAAGHSRACIMRIRSGRSMTCSCDAAAEELDEAAKAVGQAIRFARMAATRRVPMPRGVVAELVAQVNAGNAAAVLVWQWLVQRGQIPPGHDLRPLLRLVRKRT